MSGNVVGSVSGELRPDWTLSEETLPESLLHAKIVNLLLAILEHWARGRPNVDIARNVALRWDEDRPQWGVDPDLCILDPAPPEGERAKSIRTWSDGHVMPHLAIEVVSESDPRKDYVVAHEKYGACGTRELWVFDPLLAAPAALGPHLLQVWCRADDGTFERQYAGDGPAHSPYLDAYLVVVGDRLRIADDPEGARLWPTTDEAERAAKEHALARVAELEALLRARGG